MALGFARYTSDIYSLFPPTCILSKFKRAINYAAEKLARVLLFYYARINPIDQEWHFRLTYLLVNLSYSFKKKPNYIFR
jgi:hypothetical protein